MTVRTWLGGAVAIAALCGTAVAADVTHFKTNEVALPSALPDYNALIDKINASVTATGAVGANPTATAGAAAVNGSALTFTRSDAAPAIVKASDTVFGIAKVDGTTITASGGVISAPSAASGLSGMTATQIPIAASATTVSSSFALGTGVQTALGINVGSAGAPVVLNGAGGTPSAMVGTNITGIPNNSVLAQTLAAGTSVSLSAPRETYICTGTCTVTPPVPVAGYEFCVMNDDNVATVITLAALGSAAMYEATARTSYGTAGTGTLVSDGAAANAVCIRGRDATHYITVSSTGTWTAN